MKLQARSVAHGVDEAQGGGAGQDHEDGREDEQDQGGHELDGGLLGPLLGFLTAFDAKGAALVA